MKKEILLIDPHTPKEGWAESYISFNTFTIFLQNSIAARQGIKIKYYQYVLDRILAFPELQGNIPISQIHGYEDILELVSTIVFPIMDDENESFWALGSPLTPEVFYGSNAFYNLLNTASPSYVGDSYITQVQSSSLVKELQYELILQKLYNYHSEQKKEWVQGFVNPVSGLYQYYRINMDRRFTSLTTKSVLPLIDSHAIEACLECANGVQQLEDILPMKDMLASGFAIITLTNVTAKQALEQIGKEIAVMTEKNSINSFEQINLLLQTIVGNPHYRFGVMPIFTINKRPALLYENFPFSIIVKTCLEQGVPKNVFNTFINTFLKNPAPITYRPLSKNNALPDGIRIALSKTGMPFYSLAPVYAGAQLVGIFEVSTYGTEMLHDNHLRSGLLPVMPFMAQLLQNFIGKFNSVIDTIIKEKFTNLQPAVQWKFNEVAWHYFRNHLVEKKAAPMENISFKEVYPLYGAIDIRDSTIERNKALRKDMQVQLTHLKGLLQTIEKSGASNAPQKILAQCDLWLNLLADFINIEQELQLNDFLQHEVNTYLESFQNNVPNTLSEKIGRYRDMIHEDKGDAYFERRKLESSISMINSSVGQYLDLFNVELQSSYPCYFEKIRTDGVEYDIYMGQSIAPKVPFNISHFQKTRLIQLQAMAALTTLTHSLLPQLPNKLQTTQLIFVHSRSIDISFRNDERRFDVEGAYNIRYHIIKKRIDKVCISGTNERLTQVGKIAIVYYNENDAIEYQAYISQLQRDDILLNNLEHLDLEELQGVSGLKALRVGVNYE